VRLVSSKESLSGIKLASFLKNQSTAMEILSFIISKYLNIYAEKQTLTLQKHFDKLKNIPLSVENFNFYLSNSAVYSSQIEGNIIDFDSYLKYSHSGMNNNGKSFKEIEDLKLAYAFSKNNSLSLKNFLKTHKILTKTVISDKKYRGIVRDKNVFVFKDGEKIFTGATPDQVSGELLNLFSDITALMSKNLSITEIFYYASIIHLSFVQIHPFADGNGRAARLLEKWFLAEKLGESAWFLQSEKLYHQKLTLYYKNVSLGTNYANIDYDYCLPFLLMLPMALRLKRQ
jgi:Fic family protein